jgi:hypothetical protein
MSAIVPPIAGLFGDPTRRLRRLRPRLGLRGQRYSQHDTGSHHHPKATRGALMRENIVSADTRQCGANFYRSIVAQQSSSYFFNTLTHRGSDAEMELSGRFEIGSRDLMEQLAPRQKC